MISEQIFKSDIRDVVTISLFTNASDTTNLLNHHDPSANLGGWWGDTISERVWGSKIWTALRGKRVDEYLQLVKESAQSSLMWLIDDQHFKEIDVTVTGNTSNPEEVLITVVLKDFADTTNNITIAFP
ncbi:MAG: phage GP46 family protein [Oligoflexia bacterium]|nr:phage GP46 family protein [Oligoflexia bacterium]